MKCKRIRKMLPLFIGSDLSSRKMSLIRSHLERCRSCRMEYERYVKSKEVLTGWMQEKEAEWNECEWRDSISRSVPPSHRDRTALAPWPFKKIWAYAFMVLAAFVLSLMFIFPVFKGSRAGMESSLSSLGSFEPRKQDVITMTLVSRETGTKIVWFFDRNFQLEE